VAARSVFADTPVLARFLVGWATWPVGLYAGAVAFLLPRGAADGRLVDTRLIALLLARWTADVGGRDAFVVA
jgi:hypothetical protein